MEVESRVQIADRWASWMISNEAVNFVFQVLQFQAAGVSRKFQGAASISYY
jgi:hypothetical protein